MKVIHKFFVIALLLSLIFSISAVVAAENMENMTFEQSDIEDVSIETLSVSSEDQEINSVEDESSVNAAEDNEEILQVNREYQLAAGEYTFEYFKTFISNANDGDIIYLNGATFTADKNTYISSYNKGLTIIGGSKENPNLQATFNAAKTSSSLSFSSRSNSLVILNSIKFCNFKSYSLSSSGNVNIDNCIFTENSGTSISTSGATNISNCIFTKNSGTSISGYGNLIIDNCVFKDNQASALNFQDSDYVDYYDYGYYYYDMDPYNLKVTNSNFTNNKGRYSTVDIQTSYLVDYYYYGSGPKYGNKTFENCVFENNSATSGDGGVMYIAYGANIQNCTFISNSASRFGGAIYEYSYYSNFGYNTNIINNSKFISNSALEGGAIYGYSINITNSEFTSNTATYYGGALNIKSYNTIVIKNNEFTNNYAPYYNSDSMFITSNSNQIIIDLQENIINSDKTEIYFDKSVNGLYVYILDNTTVQFCEGRIKIYALITDDEGNKISARQFIFLVGEEEFTTRIVDGVAEIDYNANLSDNGKIVTEKTSLSRDKIYNGTLEIIPFSVDFDFEDYTGAMGSAIKVPIYINDASGHPFDTSIRAYYNNYEKEIQSYNGIAHVLISLPFERTSFELGVLCEGVLKTRRVYVMDPHDNTAIVIDMAESEKGYTGRTITVPVSVHDGKGNALIGDINVTYNGKTRSIPLIDGEAYILISLPVYETSFDLTVSFKGSDKVCTIDVVDPVSEIDANISLPHNVTGNIGESITIPVSVVDGDGKALTGDIIVSYYGQEIIRSLNNEGKCDIVISLPLHENSFELDVNYGGNVKSCLVEVIDPNKPTHIVINVNETYTGEPGKSLTIPVSVVDGDGKALTGNIFIEYNDHEKIETLVDGKANIVIGLPLTETSFELAITYNGHTEICLINVVDSKPHVTAVINLPANKTEYIGKTIIIPVHVTDEDGDHLQGDVVVYYNGQEKIQTLINGHTNIVISSQLHPTSFELTIAYKDKQAHCFVDVVDPNPSDDVIITLPESESGHVGNTIRVPVSVFDGNGHPLKGNIGIYYLGHERNETLQNGLADVVIILPDTPMKFNLTVTYGETESICEITVKDESGEAGNDTIIVIEVEDNIIGFVGKTLIIPVHIHDSNGNPLNGQFFALYNNNERTVNLKNGKANLVLTLPGSPTTFDLTILYEELFKTTQVIVVDPNNPMGDLNEVTSNGTSVTIPFPKDATGNVTVTINGKEYNGTVIDGQVIVNINDLVDGQYDATVKYSGDGNYSSSEKTVIIIIKDSPVTDSNHPLSNISDTQTNSDGSVVIPFPKDATGNVTVTINGKNYTGTIVDGKVVLDIKDLPAGNYTSIIYYSGDGNYSNSTKTIIIIKDGSAVSPDNPMGDTTETTSNDDGSISIPFPSDATGDVVVEIDGKYYTGKVIDGKVVLDAGNMPIGNHSAKVYYLGGGNYSASTRTITFIIKETINNNQQNTPVKPPAVNKKASKITAKKKTFKANKNVKKYAITLKSGKTAIKGVQVTIKIGKKTYKAKTNVKGKATFKIKKLTKKGKYNAVIKFKGDKTYKPTTKKVKITIK